jgi:hypothetical protein
MYVPSGEMAAPSMGFSTELAVSFRSVICGFEGSEERVTDVRTAQTRARPSATIDTLKTVHRRARPLLSFTGAMVVVPAPLSEPSIGAMKRYPRLANVSMNTGLSADSPRASLSRLTAALRL